MKELLLFTPASQVDDTLLRLGELGVVDIRQLARPASQQEAVRQELLEQAIQAIQVIQDHDGRHKDSLPRTGPLYDPRELVERVLQAQDRIEKTQKEIAALQQAQEFYHTWGKAVRRSDLQALKEKGLYLRLYLADKPLPKNQSAGHTIVSLPERDGKTPLVLIARTAAEKLRLKEVIPPELGYPEVCKNLEELLESLQTDETFIRSRAERLPELETYRAYLEEQLAMQQATDGMQDIAGYVKYLKGYIPVNTVEAFKKLAAEQPWGYTINQPQNPEEVPVHIRNPKWVSIIDPVMKFIDIVPGYKEVDVSVYFLIAFALFFAMLVGDAGYGAIFLVLAVLLRKKLPKPALLLTYVLSGATMVWGVISGTYFGSETIASIPFLNALIIDQVASFGVDNINFMMHFSFLIGALHITVAHGIKVFRLINSLRALSEVGWIALVWGLFFITEQLVLGRPMPGWSPWLMGAGALLVALFSFESKGFVKSMLASLANLPLSLISGFSDIVSYVRLFAVGMATAAVASSFNNMIVPNGFGYMGVLEILIAAVALLLGHGLNIALALMAVMVHGIRLNMLEFAGHLGVQFSGEAYRPFKLETLPYTNNNQKTKTTT